MGVRGVLVYCHCGHHVARSADPWPDEMRLSDLEPRFICQGCGNRGADVAGLPEWKPKACNQVRGDPSIGPGGVMMLGPPDRLLPRETETVAGATSQVPRGRSRPSLNLFSCGAIPTQRASREPAAILPSERQASRSENSRAARTPTTMSGMSQSSMVPIGSMARLALEVIGEIG